MNETSTATSLYISFETKTPETTLHVSGSNADEIKAALAAFGIVMPSAGEAKVLAEAPKTPADVAEKLSKKGRAKKEEVAAAPLGEPQTTSSPESPITPSADAPAAPAAEANEADEGNAAAEASAPEAPAASTASSVASATPEEAAAAVKAYGAKHGIDAARALLQRFGFARTGDITAEKAGEVVAAAGV